MNNKYHIFFISIILILFAVCYHTTLIWMYGRFMGSDSYYSHGFIIPLVSGFFIWQKKDVLKKEKVEASWWGLLFVFIALLTHILGTIIYVFSVSGFSIFFLIIGITLFIYGKNILRRIFFPLIFLLFMFPVPSAMINSISFPLKIIVTKLSVYIIGVLGIAVFQEGFNISIPAGDLLVGNPCSGLRSLITFFALGSVLAYLTPIDSVKKYILILFVIPIALICNMVRVVILILISHFWGLAAAAPESFWHNASGIFVFITGMLLLFYIGKLIEWKISKADI